MTEEGVSSGELARRVVKAGGATPDLEAESEIVRRFSRGVLFMLLHLAGDRGVAEDLHQETFRLVIEKLRDGQIRDPDCLAGFVRGIARNLVLSERRQRQRSRQVALEEVAEPSLDSDDPLEQLMAEQDRRLVHQVLGEMRSERDREVLRRVYLAGETREAICEELGLGRSNLNLVVFRARERFRELLEARAEAVRLPGVKSGPGSWH